MVPGLTHGDSMSWETVWQFHTANFVVSLSIMPEDSDPADHFEREDDIEFAREGDWHWFQARVQVSFRDSANPKNWAVTRERVLGEDYLGACSYHGLADFRTGGYFADMVREAIREARGTITRMNATLRAGV